MTFQDIDGVEWVWGGVGVRARGWGSVASCSSGWGGDQPWEKQQHFHLASEIGDCLQMSLNCPNRCPVFPTLYV